MRNLWVPGYVNGDIYDQEVDTAVTCLRPNVPRKHTACHLLANCRNLFLVCVIPRRPVNEKIVKSLGLCCRFGGASESRQIRGLSLPSKVFAISYFIRFLHNTCYKLLTTVNEWVKTHTWSMFIPCDWYNLQTTDICNSSEHLLNIVIQSVGEF